MTSPLHSEAPRAIAWNVSRACSRELAGPCAHCLAHSGDWPPIGGELSTMECLHVADELAAWGGELLVTLSGGDPLSREDLETLAAHATRRGIRVSVATSGARLSQRRAAALAASGVESLAVSLASDDPARHAALSHAGTTLDEALAGAARWAETGRPLFVSTLVSSVMLARDAGDDLARLAERAVRLGARRFDVVFPPSGSRRGALRELSGAEADLAASVLAEIEADHGDALPLSVIGQPQWIRSRPSSSGAPSHESASASRCACGLTSCRISPEGKLTACPYIDEIFGDVRRTPLLEAWRDSASLRRLREGERAGKCSWCEFAPACGGCRARALSSQGDLLAADLSCSHEPGAAAAEPAALVASAISPAPEPPEPHQAAFDFDSSPASPQTRPRRRRS